MIKPIISNIIELRKPTIPVEKHENVSEVIQDLKDSLDTKKGYALAANQIGYNKSICYIKIPLRINTKTKQVDYQETIAINPKIVEKTNKIVLRQEGCLSFPGIRIDTDRFVFCTIEYENEKRETKTALVQDLTAFVWQHEIDHLRGLIIMNRKHKAR